MLKPAPVSALRRTTEVIFVCGSGEVHGKNVGASEIKRLDRSKGFLDIRVHCVIRRDGTRDMGRLLDRIGAYDEALNATAVFVMLVEGPGEITPTLSQQSSLEEFIKTLQVVYPSAEVVFQG